MIGDAIEGRLAPAWAESRWRLVLCVIVAYGLGSYIAFALFQASTVGAVLFPPAGVTVALLYLAPRRHWWAILLAAAGTEILVDLTQGQSLRWVWGYALANTVEPLVSVSLLAWARPWARARPVLQRYFGLVLVAAVVVGPACGAAIGATTAALAEHRRWVDGFFPFWAGDALAVLTVGSAIIAWQSRRRRGEQVDGWGLVAAVAATVAATVIGFLPREVPLVALPVPVLAFVAIRRPKAVTTTAATAAMAATANLMTVLDRGPWAPMVTGPHYGLASLQLFLAVTAVMAIALTLEIQQRQRAEVVAHRESSDRRRLQALQTLTAQLATASTSAHIAEIAVREAVPRIARHGLIALMTEGAGPIARNVGGGGSVLRVWSTFGGGGAGTDGTASQVAPVPLDADLPLAVVARTGEALMLSNAAAIERRFPALPAIARLTHTHTRSLLVLPIGRAGNRYGALAFGFEREGPFDPDVLGYARTVATLVAAALERASLYERSVHTAHQLQLALLPTIAPTVGSLDAVACYRAAQVGNQVGGDWYDVFELANGRTAFLVGDVVGHDLDAAVVMGRLQNAVRILAPQSSGPGEVLGRLDWVTDLFPAARYTTLVYCEFDPLTRLLHYSSAGHPPPLLVTARSIDYLSDGRSPPLGLVGAGRIQAQVAVEPGSSLALYSDGLIEDRDQSIEVNLRSLAVAAAGLRRMTPANWCEQVLADRLDATPQTDDIVLMCLSF